MSAAVLDADVIVVGAGPAGAASALFAARTGRRVMLIDQQRFPRDKPCGEGLMPSGRAALRALGLDGEISSQAPALIGLQLGPAGGAVAAAKFPRFGSDLEGLGVRRLEFDSQMVEAAAREPRIRFCSQTRVLNVRRESAAVAVVTAQGELRARHVVAADGLRSGIRHQMGWTVGPGRPFRYGIVGHWRIDAPIDPWVRIAFADGLELYEGPVSGDQRLVALLCYQERMQDFAGRLHSRYREVAQNLRPQLLDADQVGDVQAIGPFWYQARTVARDRVFLVGDAAGFTDPITAEGIATGLRQAQAFAVALDTPNPEQAYRRAHRRLTTNPRRIARLFLRLTRTPTLVERAVRSHQVSPEIFPKLLGVGLGYWGFERITAREWVRIFTGR